MSRILVALILLLLATAWPLSSTAAVKPAPVGDGVNRPFGASDAPFSPKVLGLINEAQQQVRARKLLDAIRTLNLARSLEPNNPYVLARLGAVLNLAGDFEDGLDRLTLARKFGGADDIVLGPMLDAMLAMGQNQLVLDLFPDPATATQTFAAGLILRARAAAMQVLGDGPGATAAMKRSLAILKDYDGLMTAGRIALMQGNYDAADAQIDAALKLNPGEIEPRILKIDLAMQRGNKNAAIPMAERLVADNPRSVASLLMRVKVYLAADRADKAEPDIDRILKDQPKIPIAQYYKAVVLARHGDAQKAWDLAHSLPKEYLQIDPTVAYNVAQMAIAAGYPDSGAAILNVAVLRFPYLMEVRLLLADLRLRQKSPEHALNTLTLVQDSQDPRVAILFARTALLKKDNAGAQKYIQRALDAGGGEELRTLDKDVALKSIANYLARHPGNKLVKKQNALLLLIFGELPKAKAAYEQLLRDDPADVVALNNLSWLVVSDDPARALFLAQRAVAGVPNSANYLDTLGSMQMGRSDFKGAVVSLTKAHDLQPDNASFTYHLALALEASGQGAESQTLLQSLVKRGGFSEYDAAREMLARKLKLVEGVQAQR